ncbi:MAG TPA: DUF1365 family protein, partial [Gammaproteobacteria bacterium]|nr:DUF1365 family protein [Gammaproteobacteria bacterium]
EGSVHHHRFAPRKHSFFYRLFMLYLDLWAVTTALTLFPKKSLYS